MKTIAVHVLLLFLYISLSCFNLLTKPWSIVPSTNLESLLLRGMDTGSEWRWLSFAPHSYLSTGCWELPPWMEKVRGKNKIALLVNGWNCIKHGRSMECTYTAWKVWQLKLWLVTHVRNVGVTDGKNGPSLMSNHWLMKALSCNCASVKLLSLTSRITSRTVGVDRVRFWACNGWQKTVHLQVSKWCSRMDKTGVPHLPSQKTGREPHQECQPLWQRRPSRVLWYNWRCQEVYTPAVSPIRPQTDLAAEMRWETCDYRQQAQSQLKQLNVNATFSASQYS